MQALLRTGITAPVFLALDNVSDSISSLHEAMNYLEGSFPPGSIVMVTSRSKDVLMRLSPYINESFEMPDLALEEAKSIFVMESRFSVRTEADEQLLNHCVKRCYFKKDDNRGTYHPLALKVLGQQLSHIDPEEWWARLDSDTFGQDIFNQSMENTNPIFSILRRSFDSLSEKDQQVFMDVVLFLPKDYEERDIGSLYEWLRIVHGIQNVDDVRRRVSA